MFNNNMKSKKPWQASKLAAWMDLKISCVQTEIFFQRVRKKSNRKSSLANYMNFYFGLQSATLSNLSNLFQPEQYTL